MVAGGSSSRSGGISVLNEVRTDLSSLPFRSWTAMILLTVEHVSKVRQKALTRNWSWQALWFHDWLPLRAKRAESSPMIADFERLSNPRLGRSRYALQSSEKVGECLDTSVP